MSDITDELRLYRDLKPVWDKYMDSDFDELLGKNVDDYPKSGDPRLGQFCRVNKKLQEIALKSDTVVITEPTLHRVFQTIRVNVLAETMNEDGGIDSDEFFDDLTWKYHPNGIAKNFARTKPLVTLDELPKEVVDLITETREAFCMSLPTACISLCRSVVERSIVDIAVRCGRINDEDRLSSMGMCDRISLLIDRSVSKSSPLRQEINVFMADTSNVIHTNATADMETALKLFEEAQMLVQKLYGYYKAQLRK